MAIEIAEGPTGLQYSASENWGEKILFLSSLTRIIQKKKINDFDFLSLFLSFFYSFFPCFVLPCAFLRKINMEGNLQALHDNYVHVK